MYNENNVNTFLGIIRDRFSYRGEYKPDPVPREHLELIVEAGLAAPSGCNKQTTSLIAVDDPALIGALGALLDGSGFASAPAAICVLTRPIVAWGSVIYNVQDYGAAIENMLLAITALGYASCWVEGQITSDDEIASGMREILGVPGEYQLVAYLPVGVAGEPGSRAEKKPACERAWFNGFGV